MKITMEERVKSGMIRIGRKNRALRVAMVPALFLFMFFFSCTKGVKNNGKRLAMLAGSLVLLPIYSSFSFPAFVTKSQEEYNWDVEGAEEVTLAQEAQLNLAEVVLLEDADVLEETDALTLEEFDYSGDSHGYAMAQQYGAAEILAAAGDRSPGEILSGEETADPAAEDTGLTSEVENPEFSPEDWRLILINKQNSIPDGYEVPLGTITGNLRCDERIIEDLLDMFQAAKEDGINLMVQSPYRDMAYQELLFERKINRYMGQGFSYMEAYRLAGEYVTVPGASEHQIGLALDIVCDTYRSLTAGFADTEAGKWLAEHSCEYGFILRYPLGKEYITGIEYEPWHFRYVGEEAATVIMKQGITLEEFWEEYL